MARSARIAAIILLMTCAAALVYLSRFVLIMTLIGIGLGVLFAPWVTAIQRRFRIARGLGGLILLLVIIVCLTGLGLALVDFVSTQVGVIVGRWPEIQAGIRAQLNRFAMLRRLDLDALSDQAFRWGIDRFLLAAEVVGGLVVVIAIALYIAVRPGHYLSAVLSVFPSRRRARVSQVLAASARSFRAWFHGELLDMTAIGLMIAVGLWAIGVDFWLFFGLLSGALDIIPYIGPYIAAGITLLFVLGTEPDKLPWIAALFIVAQQLEGYLILPLIMREQADLPEVHLIVMMLLFWSLFGILGALIAAPTLAVGRTIYLMVYQPWADAKKAE